MTSFFRRSPGRLPRIALVVEGKRVNPEGLLAIRMLPTPQHGGALAGVGEKMPFSWADLEQKGLAAFDPVWEIGSEASPNVDFAPGKGLRAHNTLLLEAEQGHVVLSAEGTWASGGGARDKDRIRLSLPVGNEEFAAAVRECLS